MEGSEKKRLVIVNDCIELCCTNHSSILFNTYHSETAELSKLLAFVVRGRNGRLRRDTLSPEAGLSKYA